MRRKYSALHHRGPETASTRCTRTENRRAETSRRIKGLIAEGMPITLALYPHAEHGMTEFETKPDGERVSTRYVPGYFAMMRDFARSGALKGQYGASSITTPRQ